MPVDVAVEVTQHRPHPLDRCVDDTGASHTYHGGPNALAAFSEQALQCIEADLEHALTDIF